MASAAILSIGDELITGQTLDTNSAWLSAALVELGVMTVEHRTVGDDRAQIAEALRSLAGSAEIVIITGGLGPTLDDVSREAMGDVVDPGEPLIEDADALMQVERWFRRSARGMPASNKRQALRPRSASILPNANGTAPGLIVDRDDRFIVALPGPPRELQPMFEELIAPLIRERWRRETVATGVVRMVGLGESAAAERLGDMMSRDRNPTVGTTASGGVITARICATGPANEAQTLVERDLSEIERHWAPYAYSRGPSLVETLAVLCRERGLRLAVAESCSGGLLASHIVDIAGSSSFFLGGWVTYSNELKEVALGVPTDVIRSNGAVSGPVAEAMARGAIARAGADISLAITGIAGPDGGSDEKPVGTVYIGFGQRTDGQVVTRSRRFAFTGNRSDVRERSVVTALQWLRLALLGHGDAPLLWESRPRPPVHA